MIEYVVWLDTGHLLKKKLKHNIHVLIIETLMAVKILKSFHVSNPPKELFHHS